MYNLYYLTSTLDDKIYIGITNNPERRYYEHINYTVEKSHYNGNWIRKTLKKGGEIKMNIALSNLPKKVAIQLEIKMIALLKKITPKKVTNTAQGGLGFNHKGIPHSEEHKKAIEAAQPHKVRIPKDILYDLYVNKKLSKKKIGEIYNCGATTINRRLIEHGIPPRRTANYKISYELDKDEILDLYLNKKMPIMKIAKKYNIGSNGIRTLLKREGISTGLNKSNKTPRLGKSKIKKRINTINELLDKGYLRKDIAKVLEISSGHLSYIIKKYKIKDKNKIEPEVCLEELKKMLNDGFYKKDIANHFNISKDKLRNIIKENEIEDDESKYIHRKVNYELLYNLFVVKNMNCKQISNELNMNYSYICDIVKNKYKLR